MVSEENEEVI